MGRFLLIYLGILLPACQRDVELIDLGPLPPWQFVDQNNQPIGDVSLKGKVWAANFLFTSCPTSCPALAQATLKLQGTIEAMLDRAQMRRVAIVSVTVDPETDTTALLKTFAEKYHAHPLWHFARGDYAQMEKLVNVGFMQPIIRSDRLPGGEIPKNPTPLDTAHSLRFVLVDQMGHVRGLFDQSDGGVAQLSAAMRQLLRANN